MFEILSEAPCEMHKILAPFLNNPFKQFFVVLLGYSAKTNDGSFHKNTRLEFSMLYGNLKNNYYLGR